MDKKNKKCLSGAGKCKCSRALLLWSIQHCTTQFLWNVCVNNIYSKTGMFQEKNKNKKSFCRDTRLWFTCVLILMCVCMHSQWQHSRNAIWLQVKTFKLNCAIKQLESMLWSECNSHFALNWVADTSCSKNLVSRAKCRRERHSSGSQLADLFWQGCGEHENSVINVEKN